jgi:hypothetical protein
MIPVWKNIRKPIIEYMEEMKANRLARERSAVIMMRKRVAVDILRDYKRSQMPFESVMPEPNDFCSFPAILAVIDQPADVNINGSNFADVVPLLPGIIDDWRTSINKQLVKLLREQEKENEGRNRFISASLCEDDDNFPPDEVMIEKIKLVTTVFRCHKCLRGNRYGLTHNESDYDSDASEMQCLVYGETKETKPLFYPNVLGHQCLTKPPGWHFPMSDDPTVRLGAIRSRQKWTCECLELDQRTGMMVESLVKACGLDPATATTVDMDQLDARFACLRCITPDDLNVAPETLSVFTFGWRVAVRPSLFLSAILPHPCRFYVAQTFH